MEVSAYGGRLRYFTEVWKNITNSISILSWLEGYKIPFREKPIQGHRPIVSLLSTSEERKVAVIILKFEKQGIISQCCHSKNEYISSFFLVPKSDGSSRFILNLKNLNKFLAPVPHFKLENYKSVRDLIYKNCFMSTIDLKDAYYMIPISPNSKKFLRFEFNGLLFQYNVMPMGLSSAPYVFTKMLKPVLNKLRSLGIFCVMYLDDIFVIGRTQQETQDHVKKIIYLLEHLGFIINYKKCKLIPANTCKYLGFIYNSEKLTVELPMEKKTKIISLVTKLHNKEKVSIKELSKVFGTLIAACPAVSYGWLHIKSLERSKYLALKKFNTYKAQILITNQIKIELKWWENSILNSVKNINMENFDLEIFTDASNTGWGAVCGNNKTHGFWGEIEGSHHINYLELLAIFYALRCFALNKSHINIVFRVDNKTAIAYINKMGGIRFQKLNNLSKEIWSWCEERNIFIYATYIASKDNTVADMESRSVAIDTEYCLNMQYFQKIVFEFGNPTIDLFASNINSKCTKFISWRKDPGAIASDAFSINWGNYNNFYAFPPFSLVGRVLNKIIRDQAKGILIVPFWQTQYWYPLFLRLCVKKPLTLPPNEFLLLSPFRTPHPLWRQLSLVVGKLSGDHF